MTAALKDPARYNGVVNGVAPEPTTMGGLCEAVAEALDRPNWLPVPGFALKAGPVFQAFTCICRPFLRLSPPVTNTCCLYVYRRLSWASRREKHVSRE